MRKQAGPSSSVSPAKENPRRAVALAASMMARYVRFVDRTSKRLCDQDDFQQRFDENAPLIIAGWHGTFLLSPVLMPEPEKVSAVVARHGDAELIGQLLERFSVNLIRGAGAGGKQKDKGGAYALRMAIRELKAGRSIAMTADVPPGPARRAGIGTITLARLSGRPILPVAAVTSRFKVLNTWSRFVVNLPFSKLALLAGEPLIVPRDADEAQREALRLELERRINELVAKGHELVGADPVRTDAPRVGDAPAPGMSLKTYRAAMHAARPLAGVILKWRARRGKEDLTRLHERRGEPHLARPKGPLIWLHAASVGETNAVLPLIEALDRDYPGHILLLTSGTVTSARIAAKRLPDGAIHQFIPLDNPGFMQRFLQHWQPAIAILVESEIWPNLVLETADQGIPLVLANAIMSVKSYKGWRRRPGLSRPLFGRFHKILAQNEAMEKRFLRLGAPDVEVAGNLKFDAPRLPLDERELAALKAVIGARPLWLAASTHKGEEEQIIAAHEKLRENHVDLLTILLPRHPERGGEIEALVKAAGLDCARRSNGEAPGDDCALYLADTLGETGLFYALCPITFMGGSLVERGGHNPVEALPFGTAVLTGPHWHNQADSFAALLTAGGARQVAGADELAEEVSGLLHEPAQRAHMTLRADQVMAPLRGALTRTLAAIAPLLEESAARTGNTGEGVS